VAAVGVGSTFVKGLNDFCPGRRAVNGTERKANGEKTGHQVSPPAKEVAERQKSVKTGQKEVMGIINFV
jgi:hypothetical protein